MTHLSWPRNKGRWDGAASRRERRRDVAAIKRGATSPLAMAAQEYHRCTREMRDCKARLEAEPDNKLYQVVLKQKMLKRATAWHSYQKAWRMR